MSLLSDLKKAMDEGRLQDIKKIVTDARATIAYHKDRRRQKKRRKYYRVLAREKSQRVYKQCVVCGMILHFKDQKRSLSDFKNRTKTCSVECRRIYTKNQITKQTPDRKCLNCSSKIQRRLNRRFLGVQAYLKRKFCSKICFWKYRRQNPK